MTRSVNEARALRVMVDDLRAEAPPALDWDAMERRLMVGIAADEARAGADDRRREASVVAGPASWFVRAPFGRMLAAAAAVACLVGGAAALRGAGSTSAPVASRQIDASAVALAPGEAGVRGAHDVLGLAPGDAIEAGDAPVSFDAKGVVRWTLAPGSRAVVRSIGKGGVGHTVALERGSIHAEVVPRDATTEGLVEAFAVEVDRTRVAVHGTAFTVTRDGSSVEVEVEHGAVAVGPAGRGGITTGHMLVGHARASFSLDGAKSARFLPIEVPTTVIEATAPAAPVAGRGALAFGGAPAPAAGPAHDEGPAALAARSRGEAIAAAQPVGASARTREAAAPPPGEPAVSSAPPATEKKLMTPAGVSSQLGACFARSFQQSSSSVRVTVTSSLRLSLDASGAVRGARFDPPVAAALQDCATFVFGARFAAGQSEVTIPVTFQPR